MYETHARVKDHIKHFVMYVPGKEDPKIFQILIFTIKVDDDDDGDDDDDDDNETKLEEIYQAAIFSTAPNHVQIQVPYM